MLIKGRFIVVSFHSMEDRLVKQHFKALENMGKVEILTKKPITADMDEVQYNKRSRSAKLRVAERIVFPDECCETAEKLRFLVKDKANGWRRPALLGKIRMAFSQS